MSMKYKELENSVLSLDENERASLALRLISTLDKGKAVHSDKAWIREAEKRYQEYKEGKVEGVSVENVFKEAYKKLND